MKKIEIFDPAMCCPTGLCGTNIDPELMRIAVVIETLKKHISFSNITRSQAERLKDYLIRYN